MITRDEMAEIIREHTGPFEVTNGRFKNAADAIVARLGDGWKPFSDAPKTGELVDLWAGGHRVADARYSTTRDCWLTSHDTIVIGVPTHFMFRPEAPKRSV